MTVIINGTDNAVGNPAIQGGTGGTSAGLYYPAANTVAITTSGVNALTISSTQAATFTGSISSLNTFGFKNRIINGGMVINQRGASGNITTGAYQVDRFKCFLDTTPLTMTFTQSTTAPAGFINSALFTVTSPGTVTSGQGNTFLQSIEGLNVADLGWGTADAKTVTVSAWVRSSATGTFGGSLTNYNNTRSYPFTYTISSANTWTQISITIPGDTTGTWKTDTSSGIVLWFSFGTGSTLSGTAGAWAGANYISATGATNIVGTNGATFYITGVQLEVGSQATSFDFRDYGRELIMCQRYYYKQQAGGQPYPRYATGFATSSGAIEAQTVFPVAMRVAPTSIDVGGTLGIWAGATIFTVFTITLTTSGTCTTSGVTTSTTSGLTTGVAYQIISSNSTTAYLAFNAEI